MKATFTALKIIAVFLFISMEASGQKEAGIFIVNRMIERTSKIKTMTYQITKEERINGKMFKQVAWVKLQIDPVKLYMKEIVPNKGLEILYARGVNNDKAIVNPNGFPWININLDPKDDLMRKNQHHTILESGFHYLINVLEYTCIRYKAEIETMIINNGIVNYGGKECYSLSMNNLHFSYLDYELQENESTVDVAQRFKISEHMVLELNKSIKNYGEAGKRQTIKIPSDYCSKIILVVDKEAFLPLKMEIYDDQGLYEKYEFSELKVNTKISAEEFSQDYAEYGF
ncbi:MAG: outer membrane lipoprotein-sorting protein [Cyclobacteriaceae bacterium]|jgi:outer membrane lipoprotein-sorting protein